MEFGCSHGGVRNTIFNFDLRGFSLQFYFLIYIIDCWKALYGTVYMYWKKFVFMIFFILHTYLYKYSIISYCAEIPAPTICLFKFKSDKYLPCAVELKHKSYNWENNNNKTIWEFSKIYSLTTRSMNKLWAEYY